MDQLDHSAETLFATAAASGLPAKIASQADQLTVARWCALIAVLADQAQVLPVVEPAAHKALAAGGIPDGTRVWLLKTEPPEWRAHGWLDPREFQLGPGDGPTPPNAYFITFGIHYLVIQVFIPTSRTPPVVLERTGTAALVRELWPSLLTPVIYPRRARGSSALVVAEEPKGDAADPGYRSRGTVHLALKPVDSGASLPKAEAHLSAAMRID